MGYKNLIFSEKSSTFNLQPSALVVQLARFGDILQTIPLLTNLKNRNFKISLLIDEKNFTLCNDLEIIDRVIPFKIGKFLTFLKNKDYKSCYFELYEFIKYLKNENFDFLINLNHSKINFIISELLDIPEKLGFKFSNKKFINYLYSIIGSNRKLNPFNLVDVFNYFIKDFKVIKLHINDKSFLKVDELPEKYIIIHPGAGHLLRVLNSEILINFINIFLEQYKDFFIILTGSENEKNIGDGILKRINSDKILNFIGKTNYLQLKYLLKKCKLLISTDTGIMHLAASLNCKILALFYASAFPFETGPYTEKALVVTPNLECYPCTEFRHCNTLHCKELIDEKIILNCCKVLLNNDKENKIFKNVIIYKPYFDEHGIYLKEKFGQFDKFYNDRLKNRIKGLQILKNV